MSLREELDKMREEERAAPQEDGYDFYVSDHAYANALKFIPLMERYPMPHLASSGAAEVVFAFTLKKELRPCVRVTFRGKPDERDYIYYDFGEEHDAVDLTEAALVTSLDRLFTEQPSTGR